MEPSEKELSRDKRFAAKDRWYARRRCAMRELIEECGASKDPLPTSDTQPFIQPLGTAPGLCEAVKVPQRLLRAALPPNIAPPERVRITAVQTKGSYFFVYTLTKADGAFLNWRPRAMRTCGGEHPPSHVACADAHSHKPQTRSPKKQKEKKKCKSCGGPEVARTSRTSLDPPE